MSDRAIMRHVMIGGVPAATASRSELVDRLVFDCRARRDDPTRRAVLVFDSNAQALSLYATDPAYRAAVDAADIVHADSMFVVFASRVLTAAPVPERSATTDFIHDAAARCAREGLSFYLFGGTEEVNATCARRLEDLYPGLVIAGRRNGFFAAQDEEEILESIAAAAPDVLWIGLGKPKEQMFAARHADRLAAGWVVTAGGCFNFVTGHYSRAPDWMQAAGLEWLHRMATGPDGIARRYVTTLPHAVVLTALRSRRAPVVLRREGAE
jgi:exopolysaccharide biosynthesis WecB/TagA/CpsF family protein